jgi:hypothetical protein
MACRSAVARKSCSRRTSKQVAAHFVMGFNRVTCSISWSDPMPNSKMGFFPDRTTMGEFAYMTLAIPVTASVTPGPAVTAAIPG